MVLIRGTKKFLDRVGRPTATAAEQSTGALGSWYATVLFWKPQVALFVNESTLLPVLVPFAPAATVVHRLPATLATVLGALTIEHSFIEHEVAQMTGYRLASTSNRSVLGSMNEFVHLAEAFRNDVHDLVALSLRLAEFRADRFMVGM